MNMNSNNLTDWILFLADSNLVLAQRNAEWCAHGPILEQDIAITNITLDLIGQSRNFYQYAATLINNEDPGANATEDSLAYLRTERAFKNLLITELPNGDWAQTITRQFFCSVYQYLLYDQLQNNKNEIVAAIASKAIKEVIYHLRWSSEWVIRLGDGTDESHARMNKAIRYLWMYTGEFFIPAEYEQVEITGIDIASLKDTWLDKITAIFQQATLAVPEKSFMQTGGKTGSHTEHLGFILTELQYLQRTYPGAEW
jgi:ring-1,2-phenylacetyl-CoA epoxidase subunit PaaC